MQAYKIAIPSALPGGLEAGLGMHFGHCDIYTIVNVENGAITSVTTLENPPHEHGGCLAPVGILSASGVTTLLAGGMGMRPLMGFQEAGVTVCHSGTCTTVAEAVEAFVAGKLLPFGTDNTCKGGCHES